MNLKNVQKASSPNSIVSVVESTQNSYLSKSEDVLKITLVKITLVKISHKYYISKE